MTYQWQRLISPVVFCWLKDSVTLKQTPWVLLWCPQTLCSQQWSMSSDQVKFWAHRSEMLIFSNSNLILIYLQSHFDEVICINCVVYQKCDSHRDYPVQRKYLSIFCSVYSSFCTWSTSLVPYVSGQKSRLKFGNLCPRKSKLIFESISTLLFFQLCWWLHCRQHPFRSVFPLKYFQGVFFISEKGTQMVKHSRFLFGRQACLTACWARLLFTFSAGHRGIWELTWCFDLPKALNYPF